MAFFQWLIDLDIWLFSVFNRLPHPQILNQLFLFFSFYPLIIWSVICLVLIWLEEQKDRLFIIKFIMALGVAGIVVSGIIKPIVGRPRPDLQLETEIVVVNEKPALLFWNNDYAFPSGHAAIAFAGAYLLSKELKNKKRRLRLSVIFYTIAALTAISRIYLGKHFPLDVTIGALIGVMVASFTWQVIGKLVKVKKS